MAVVQIITAYENQAAALALSTPEGGIPECSFVALATTDPAGGGIAPTHCWDNGNIDDSIIARFEADPTNYDVTNYPNRQAFKALENHDPQLYTWVAG